MFDGVRRALFEGARLGEVCDLSTVADKDLDALLGLLAPEALLLLMHRAGVPMTDVLLDIFNQLDAAPNAVHEVAAFAAARQIPVWTTNYDTLIEEAAAVRGLDLAVSVSTVEDQPGSAELVKVHGSFTVRQGGQRRWAVASDLLYTAPPLIAGLPGAVYQRLVEDVADAHLVVLGYAGADVDVYPALREAIPQARSVTWFDVPDPTRTAALVDRYGLIASDATATRTGHHIVRSPDPTRAFVQWACDELPEIDATLRTDLLARPTGLRKARLDCPELPMDTKARVRLAYQLGLGATVLESETKGVSRMFRRRLSTRARGRAVRSSTLRAAMLTVVGQVPVPARTRDWSRRLATQVRTSDETYPSTPTILRWLDQAWEPHLALGATHALKYDGRLGEALVLALTSLERAKQDSERVDPIGALSFQCSDLMSIAGDFDGARDQARLGYGSISNVVMALWEQLVPIATDVAEGRMLSEAQITQLTAIRRLFRLTHQHDGDLWAGLAHGLGLKNAREWEDSVALFTRICAGARGDHDNPGLPGIAALAHLQLADIARLRGDTRTAREHLDQVAEQTSLVGLWAELIRGLLDPTRHLEWRDELQVAFQRSGCPLGVAMVDATRSESSDAILVNWT